MSPSGRRETAVALDHRLRLGVLVEVDHRGVDLAVAVRVELVEIGHAVAVGVGRHQVNAVVAAGLYGVVTHARSSLDGQLRTVRPAASIARIASADSSN